MCRKPFLLLCSVILLSLITLGVSCSNSDPTDIVGAIESVPLSDSVSAPSFTGKDVLTGESISLTDFDTNVVLLNLVNYGCDSRINQVVSRQLMAIKDLKEQRGDFEPISVFCGCCPENTLRGFADVNELDWPWILDTDNSILAQYTMYVQKYGYPTLVLIDQNQRVRTVSGYLGSSQLSAEIDELLAWSGKSSVLGGTSNA
jgi:hypothetical protein